MNKADNASHYAEQAHTSLQRAHEYRAMVDSTSRVDDLTPTEIALSQLEAQVGIGNALLAVTEQLRRIRAELAATRLS